MNLIGFVVASAVSRTRSRTGPSHCTPRRYIGVEGETRLPPSARAERPQDQRQPSPWLRRPTPLNSRLSTPSGGFQGPEVEGPRPAGGGPKLGYPEKLASACQSSAYATFVRQNVDS